MVPADTLDGSEDGMGLPDQREPDSDEELLAKIKKWLAKTGYPLEMRVARAARRSRARWVDQSQNYFDASTDKVRETDVVVTFASQFGEWDGLILLVIECKAKPAPWVVFDDGSGLSDDAAQRMRWSVRRTRDDAIGDGRTLALRGKAFTGDGLFKPSLVGMSVVEVDFKSGERDHDPDNKQPSVRNRAWDAVRAAVSAAHGIVRELDLQAFEESGGGVVAFPVVVTSGKLFRSYLDGEQMRTEPVDRAEVTVRTGERQDETRCVIVTEQALPRLLTEAEKTVEVFTRGG